MKRLHGRALAIREYGIVVAFVALFIGLAFATPAFLHRQNLENILDQSAPVGLLASGETLCILAGVFDLSVGAMLTVAGVVAALAANETSSWLGIAAGIGTGLGLGIANGILIDRTRVNSFIGTLATGIVFGGIAVVITGGLVVTVTKPSFSTIGQGDLLGLPDTAWIFLGFAALLSLLVARTTFGRYVYAVGGNPEAARLSGIRVGLVRGSCLALSGLAAGLAGVLSAARTSSATANLGTGMELTAISAAVVGGTSIFGGEGAIWRGVLGVLFLALIGNGFNLLSVDTTYQQIVEGGLILMAVAADQLLREA